LLTFAQLEFEWIGDVLVDDPFSPETGKNGASIGRRRRPGAAVLANLTLPSMRQMRGWR
jgi:hypothetical protein